MPLCPSCPRLLSDRERKQGGRGCVWGGPAWTLALGNKGLV